MALLLALLLAMPGYALEPQRKPPPEQINRRSEKNPERKPLTGNEVQPLTGLADGRFSFKDGKLLDSRVDPPRALSPEEARELLELLRVRETLEAGEKMRPEELAAALRSIRAHPKLYFPQAGPRAPEKAEELAVDFEHLAQGRGLGLYSGEFGLRPAALRSVGVAQSVGRATRLAVEMNAAKIGDWKGRRRDVKALPSRKDARVPPPKGTISPRVARQVEGFKTDITDLDKKFRDAFKSLMGHKAQGSWINNACRGETCGLYAQTYKGIIKRNKLPEKYPDLEFVTLYQPGKYAENKWLNWIPNMKTAGNHEFLGVVAEGRLVSYIDPWANPKGKVYHPFTGKGDMPLDRAWLGVIPWNGAAHYKVDDNGLPVR